MATTIARVTRKRARGGYPWDRWTDGKARRARRRKDFRCSPEGFKATLASHAARKGLAVTVSIKGNAVEFQFSKKGEP